MRLLLLALAACAGDPASDDRPDSPPEDSARPDSADDSAAGGDSADSRDTVDSQDSEDSAAPTLEAPSGWRSALYPADWTPGWTSPGGFTLHDFSYAGYRRGEAPIPDTIPGVFITVDAAYGVDPTGAQDSTAGIQRALDEAASAGGGVVYLPPGEYRVAPQGDDDAALYIDASGVVLRGAGQARTAIFNDREDMRGKYVIRVGGRSSSASRWDTTAAGVALTQDAEAHDSAVRVADASAFSPGDWVIVRGEASEAWIAEHDMEGLWTSSLDGPLFLREVLAVDGDQLALDIPLRYPVRTRDDARVAPAGEIVREVGVEDLSIGMIAHPGSGWGDEDYNSSGTGAYDVHSSDALRFSYVVDGWLRRVSSYAPPGNPDDVHILSDGVTLYQSRNVTVQDTQLSHPQYEGGGGNGYSFVLQGSDNLIVNCVSVSARHAYSFKTTAASGNVVLRSAAADPRLPTDFHMHLSMANLLDSLVMLGDMVDATYRPYGTVEHGHTTTESVIWNTDGRYGLRDDTLVDSRQYGLGAVVGTSGPADVVQTTPLTDTRDTAPEDLVEGEGMGGTLTPASLYDDQLHRRLYGEAAPTGAELQRLSPTQDAFVEGGDSAEQSFGGEASLRVKDASGSYQRRSFLQFDLSEVDREVLGATLILRAQVADGGGSVADVRARAVEDDAWTEDTLTWSTQPELGARAARGLAEEEAGELALDVTALVQADSDGPLLSLALDQDMGGAGLNVMFASREADQGQPVLELLLAPEDHLTITEATSTGAQEGTSAASVLDGDLDTRWSNEDRGGSLTLDLGQVRAVYGVDLAFYRGDERLAFVELRASEDGETWTSLGSVYGRGHTQQLQRFEVPETSARFVQVVGLGNSQSAWNSVTEARVRGR